MAQATQTKTVKSGDGMPMENAMDLLIHELSDMRSAEEIILGMLKTAAGAATNAELKKGLEKHREQTQGHLENVDAAFKAMGMQPHEVGCKGAKGLLEELKEAIEAKPAPEVLDLMIAGGAAKTENYEICAYTGMVDLAKLLGETEAEKLLSANLKQEEETLKKVEAMEETLSKKLPVPASSKR
ncbi:ferritin-like domain-containing protein [soil metagenome]